MLILQTLQWGAQHGYGIGQALRAQSGEVLQVETGSLYPALHRMERQGWILSKWATPSRISAPSITASRQKARNNWLATAPWETMVAAIGNILTPNPEG